MRSLIKKILSEETSNKFLKNEVREYLYDIFSKHDYDNTVFDGFIIIWGGEVYDTENILLEFKDVTLDMPNMVDGEYVQFPDEFRGDLWISEKLLYRINSYIPLEREEMIDIIVDTFKDEFSDLDPIINSVSFGDETPSEYTRIGGL